jgi:hypothetical protein
MPDTAPRAGRTFLHVAALWALAVAGPIFDVLSGSAEFFVAYRAGRSEVVAFVLAMALAPPVLSTGVIWLAGRVSPALGRLGLAGIVSALVAILAAQALQPAALSTAVHVSVASGIGLAAGILYATAPAVRSFATWLSPAIVIFPVVFLRHDAIRPMVWPPYTAAAIDPGDRDGAGTPIVFVIFDQFPLTSLLEPDGTIDARKYPGFAELARTSVWFRNATTVGDFTRYALPPIVSGRFAEQHQLPTASSYPNNLFTALSRSHRMEVFEPLTTLCPRTTCEPLDPSSLGASLVSMVSDAGVVLVHRVASSAIVDTLPPLTDNWRGFVEAQGFQRQWASQRDADRRKSLDDFLAAIDGDDADATLYFLHALLPHEPYEYLPSGQDSGSHRRVMGTSRGRWTKQEWPVVQTYARHLLQVQFVDGFVERLIQRLRDQGLFDEALVIVTADHGVSFVPGEHMKTLTMTTAASVMPVPLFVKMPSQSLGRVSDRNAQTVDVLPMIADILNVDLPFPTDGRSQLDENAPGEPSKTIVHAGGRSRTTFEARELAAMYDVVRRRIQWFGGAPDGPWSPLMEPARHLRGRLVADLRVEEDPEIRIAVDEDEVLAGANPAADTVPAVVSGRVRGTIGRSQGLVVAVAVNGRIAATTATYQDVEGLADGQWMALVPPTMYREGFNDVRIYVVETTPSGERLIEGYRTDPPAS